MSTKKTASKALNITLWVAQVLLAVMFIMIGLMKLTQPLEEVSKNLRWADNFPLLPRFIGTAEFLGGIGLLLPSLLRIKTALTYWAALGLAVTMVFAAIYHAMYGEYSGVGVTLILGAIALFVAWGRYKKVPIAFKGQQVSFS